MLHCTLTPLFSFLTCLRPPIAALNIPVPVISPAYISTHSQLSKNGYILKIQKLKMLMDLSVRYVRFLSEM